MFPISLQEYSVAIDRKVAAESRRFSCLILLNNIYIGLLLNLMSWKVEHFKHLWLQFMLHIFSNKWSQHCFVTYWTYYCEVMLLLDILINVMSKSAYISENAWCKLEKCDTVAPIWYGQVGKVPCLVTHLVRLDSGGNPPMPLLFLNMDTQHIAVKGEEE